ADEALETPAPVAAKPKQEKKQARKPAEGILQKTLARYTGSAPKRDSISSRIVTRKLENGLTVNVLKEKVGSGTVAVGVAVKAGNYFEGNDKQNLADVVASMLPMGSEGLSKEALADKLTEMGVRSGLHIHVGPYVAQANVQVVSEDLTPFLALLSTVLRQPAFDPAELDKVKLEWIGRYKQESAFPAAVANNTLGNVLYRPGTMFYQKTHDEQMADLTTMTVDDLVAFHGAFYTPSSTLFTIVGDVEPDDAMAQVEAVYGAWTGPQAPAIVVPPPVVQGAQTVVKKMPDKPGVQIVLGSPLALKKSDPDFHAALVGMRVLGGDTLTARLGKKLREQGGLTYGVYTGQWDNSYGGAPWYIALSVNATNVEPALKMVGDIVRDFVANGITEAELKTQINNMIGGHQLGLTTMFELADKIAEYSALGLSLDGIDTYASKLRELTVDAVNAAIKRHFDPSKLVTVIAGDV
ncbi:MAG TPA: pitrilysin family protein, partial [Candidatus Obscuribacterales bacterium]